MNDIQDMTKQIDFNNLNYYFTDPNINPINFIKFKDPMHLYKDIRNGNISVEIAEKDKNQSESDLNQITIGNLKYEKEYQLNTITNFKIIITHNKKLLIYLMIMLKLYMKLYIKQNREQDLKY